MILNESQQAVVDSKASLRVVIASPGSGKTRTMVEAIKAAMKADRPGGPNVIKIAVMTFTNAGANEFRHRLPLGGSSGYIDGEIVKGDPFKLSHCGTLHSYCFKMIQRYGGHLGYIPGKVAILPDKERIPRLLACRDKLGYKISQKLLEERREFGPCPPGAAGDIHHGIQLVWKEYEFLLKRNNLVDWNGSLRVALELLRTGSVPPLDYLFVDEVQDSAKIDWLIYDAIRATNKMFIGDADQSIFAFRGAYPEEFVRIANQALELHRLEVNYRSDIRICEAANRLIAHNNQRVPKQIKASTSLVGHAMADGFEDVGQEFAHVHSLLSACSDAYEYKDIALLYRTNHDAQVCRDYLLSMGTPIDTLKFAPRPPDWERAELILGLVQAPESDILAERFMLLDHAPSDVKRWMLESHAKGCPAWTTPHIFRTPEHDPGAGGFKRETVLLAMNRVSESTIRLIQARSEALPPDATLSDLLHDLHSAEEPTASNEAAGVYVGTMHSAKGMEFDVVFLPAFEQGIMPHVASAKDQNGGSWTVSSALEEERRLAFVAITRARHELYISYSAYRKGQWGQVGQGLPSQFIKEMGLQ